MIEKIIKETARQVVAFANAKKDELEKLSDDQLSELIHECENIKPRYPASMRLASETLCEVAKVIRDERK